MPRKDRTFNDKDVIRIIVKHLTVDEQLNVASFLDNEILNLIDGKLEPLNNLLVDILQFKDIIQPILNGLEFLPGVGQVIDVVDQIFDAAEQALLESGKKT